MYFSSPAPRSGYAFNRTSVPPFFPYEPGEPVRRRPGTVGREPLIRCPRPHGGAAAWMEPGSVSVGHGPGAGGNQGTAIDRGTPSAPSNLTETDAATPCKPADEARAGTPGTGQALCPRCGGRGTVASGPCPDCAGTGKITAGIGGG